MPTLSEAKMPKPESWKEFESICADLLKELWEDPYVKRYGKQGNSQNGIDILGEPNHITIGSAGAQCKRKNEQKLRFSKVEEEVDDAEEFEPPLKEFLMMTTSDKNSKLEDKVRKLSEERQEAGKFPVKILFWEDICLELSNYQDLMIKHFPQFVENPDSMKNVIEKIMNSTMKDWKFDDAEGVYTFKPDVKLQIVREPYEDQQEFEEEWLENYPDPSGRTNHHKIYYNSTLIRKVFVVGVDGHRCNIPYPEYEWNSEKSKRENMHLTEFKYKIGRILNKVHYEMEPNVVGVPSRTNLEDKLERAGIDYPELELT